MRDNLLKNLNDEQHKAVTHKDGPLLIVAGAGTGKTTVITRRIAYIIEQGMAKSDEILALTFTEKAAGEMEERVDKLLPMGYLDLWISTFHSFGERILKEHGLEIGLPADFKLLNEFEQWSLVRKNSDKFDLDYYRPMGNPTKFIHALIKHFSRAKDEDISPADYLKYAEELRENLDGMLSGSKVKSQKLKVKSFANVNGKIDKEIVEQEVLRINEVANAYHVYQQLLLDNSFLDFGDLINYSLKLFRERPAVLEKYRNQFKYILLDEFQDTNWSQYELIKMLARPKNNLAVVGDDDQCLPGNSLILTKQGKKRIDKIKAGDEVATAVGKGHLSYSKVSYVNKNKKNTRLLIFTTKSGHKITTTDNHKMFCFTPTNSIDIKGKKYYYVYLMHKQELGWRLGITNNLTVRLRLERSADRIVAIQVYDTEEEARYNELLLSLKYGVPTVCFQERNGMMDQKRWSEKLYKDLDVDANVQKLANDLNIDLSAHQVCLDAVNRGGKVRIKINLEMCCRNYRFKHAKGIFLQNPKVLHQLTIETSHKPTLTKLKNLKFDLRKAKKKGKRMQITSVDLAYLGKIAMKIQEETGGIIENKINVGTVNVQHKKAIVVPASNVLPGMRLPIVTDKGIVYDQIINREESNKNITVYDLEVERTHNFVANGVVVHNSIYKFRGASVSNILQFKKDFSKSEEIFLVNNYRNKQSILDLSYDFIKLNDPNRLEYQLNKSQKSKVKSQKLNKKLDAQEKGEGVIEVIQGGDLQEEVSNVVEKIADIKINNKNDSWNDFAVLVRANNSAKDFCNALEIAGLPYQFFSSRGLYAKPVIMDVIAYLKLLDDYHESAAVYRILNLPIFDFSYQELVNFNYLARKKAWSLYTVLRDSNGKLGREIQKKIDKVLQLISKHTAMARDKSVSEIVMAFLNDSGYLKYLMGRGERESREAMGLLNQFLKRIKKFESTSDDKSVKAFLAELNMEIDAGEQGSLAPDIESGPEAIKVMTIHAAKGLEFKYLFIVNMVDKRFPTVERKEPILIPDALIKEILPEGDIHLEEERRLFYVAMTRAKEGLYFSWATDYGGIRKKKPSRFLAETGLIHGNKDTRTQDTITKQNSIINNQTPNKQVRQNEKADIKIPNYFSYTQLAAFSNCPYQYRFAHILRIPMRGKPVFSFGKTMHSTLQKIFELVNEKKGFGQGDLFTPHPPAPSPIQEMGSNNNPPSCLGGAGGGNISFDEILEIYEQSWIDDWYESNDQKREYKKKGKEILKEFYKKYRDNWPNAVFLEKGFNIKLRDNNEIYTIRGVIDRIDEEGGKLKIIDYKTGSPKDKISFNEKEQLLIYQMAVSEIFRQDISSLAFYYLNNNSEVEFLGTEEELDKTRDKILNIIKEIKKGEFPAKPSQLCKFCDFNSICEFRKN